MQNAYADYDGRIEPLIRRLYKLTEQFGEDYARELREIYSSWHEVLRQDRAATDHAVATFQRNNPRTPLPRRLPAASLTLEQEKLHQ